MKLITPNQICNLIDKYSSILKEIDINVLYVKRQPVFPSMEERRNFRELSEK